MSNDETAVLEAVVLGTLECECDTEQLTWVVRDLLLMARGMELHQVAELAAWYGIGVLVE